ncbi:MAG: cytochrome c [Deltaproteobacteria bacterium]|nr:cytochrome c [Deltaproteobacteria bacterium]
MNWIILSGFLILSSATAQAADAAAGKAKYDTLCTSCHGPAGKGDGVAAAALNPKPRDLTVTVKTDAELAKVIKEGGAAAGLSPSMPPWGGVLNDLDIANVIAHIRSLKK